MLFYEHIPATFIERYKRFFARMKLETGEEVIAHCHNPGKMEGLLVPGAMCSLQKAEGKLKYKWQMTFIENTWVGVNTMIPNMIVKNLISNKLLEGFESFDIFRCEPRILQLNHRADFEIENKNEKTLIEVKNVHWKRNPQKDIVYFPDCVTERGKKHMEIMESLSKNRSYDHLFTIFVIQRSDCEKVTVAEDIDPKFCSAFKKAIDAGMKCFGLSLKLSPGSYELQKKIPLVL